jgi:hypothetical protein
MLLTAMLAATPGYPPLNMRAWTASNDLTSEKQSTYENAIIHIDDSCGAQSFQGRIRR